MCMTAQFLAAMASPAQGWSWEIEPRLDLRGPWTWEYKRLVTLVIAFQEPFVAYLHVNLLLRWKEK